MRCKSSLNTIGLIVLFAVNISWAATGVVTGVVQDAATGKPLPGANVALEGTAMGAVSSYEGDYRLPRVPEGEYTIVISYIGYKTVRIPVAVAPGVENQNDAALDLDVIEGKEVLVTAQLKGQAQAINLQLSSNTIVNVVSADRIRELPDENAAESVGRLPGISVRRSGGEGTRVNVRGLSPKFSSITVDGERIPATGQGRSVFTIKFSGGQSLDASVDDRSVDLSMISSEALGGIEVFKALTPDMDADAIGGTVNFVTRKAPAGLRARVNLMGGYTGYHETMGNFKGNATVSRRLLDDKLGLMLSATFDRAARNHDQQKANWRWIGETTALMNVIISDRIETRDRYSANFIADYGAGNHEFRATGMYGRTNRDIFDRDVEVNISKNRIDYDLGRSRPRIHFYSGSLSGKHPSSFIDMDWKLNYTATFDKNDFSYGYGFGQSGIPGISADIFSVTRTASYDFTTATGGIPGRGSITSREDLNTSAQVNFTRAYSLGLQFSGNLKFGAKYRLKNRERRRTDGLFTNGNAYRSAYLADNPETVVYGVGNPGISMINYQDASFDTSGFFDGAHPFANQLYGNKPEELFNRYQSIYTSNRLVNELDDYDANEAISAGYLMTDINLGRRLTLLGGVRYEYDNNDYAAYYINNFDEYIDGTIEGNFERRTSDRSNGEWLPMAHLKYAFLRNEISNNGIDLRLAATRTLTRPDYRNLTPYTRKDNAGNSLERSNPELKPTIALNYDAFLTAYHNRLGLFTIGAFYKELENIDFIYAREANPNIDGEEFKGYTIVEPKNSKHITTVRGLELEVQTNLSWLPSPFDGVVIYGNMSQIRSEALVPFNLRLINPDYTTTFIDTVREARLPGQANSIVNLAIGYDKGRFSGRVSYYFQGKSLDRLGENENMDVWTDDFARIDIALTYKILDMVSFAANFNNLNNRHDLSYTGTTDHPTSETIYGWRSTFGLRFTY